MSSSWIYFCRWDSTLEPQSIKIFKPHRRTYQNRLLLDRVFKQHVPGKLQVMLLTPVANLFWKGFYKQGRHMLMEMIPKLIDLNTVDIKINFRQSIHYVIAETLFKTLCKPACPRQVIFFQSGCFQCQFISIQWRLWDSIQTAEIEFPINNRHLKSHNAVSFPSEYDEEFY